MLCLELCIFVFIKAYIYFCWGLLDCFQDLWVLGRLYLELIREFTFESFPLVNLLINSLALEVWVLRGSSLIRNEEYLALMNLLMDDDVEALFE